MASSSTSRVSVTRIDIPGTPEPSWAEMILQVPQEIRLGKEGFEELWNEHPAEKGKVKIFGKIRETPRFQQSYGKSYTFSGMQHTHKPIVDGSFLDRVLQWTSQHSGMGYNAILVNWYPDGNASIGSHSDSESQLVSGSTVYTFSFGAERDFCITSKSDKTFRKVISLPNNSCLGMCGPGFQKYLKHAVPARKKSTGRRISVTVRLFK
jgi:alkylated DNA repair dioxygenase AlkB